MSVKDLEESARIIAGALEDNFTSPNELDINLESANMVDVGFAISRSIDRLAEALERLGMNNASGPMGAIEGVGAALLEIARCIRERDDGG